MRWTTEPPRPEDPATAQPRGIEGIRLRLMPEYGVRYPVWDEGGPVEDAALLLDLGLSSELIEDLRLWQLEWDEVSSASVADDTAPIRPLPLRCLEEHRARGRALVERAQRELGAPYVMTYRP